MIEHPPQPSDERRERLAARLKKCAAMLRGEKAWLWEPSTDPVLEAEMLRHRAVCADLEHFGCNIMQSAEAMEEAADLLSAAPAPQDVTALLVGRPLPVPALDPEVSREPDATPESGNKTVRRLYDVKARIWAIANPLNSSVLAELASDLDRAIAEVECAIAAQPSPAAHRPEPSEALKQLRRKAQERIGDKRAVGLYAKFRVDRTDGQSEPGQKHHECEYFVLDLTHDPHAPAAIRAYAESCRADYPLLAADLDQKLALASPSSARPEPPSRAEEQR